MASSADEVFATKQALRKEIRGRLKSLTRDEIQTQSLAVWDRLHKLPAYRQAKSIGLFLSMPRGEIDTDPALAHAISTGKTIYVPQVGQNFESADMELHQVILDSKNMQDDNNTDADADAVALFHHTWPRNKWGIPEPPGDTPMELAQPGDIDVLVVPGLAFDRKGNRLGQGKGYYDRFMARMFATDSDGDNKKKPPLLIAVGLSCQLVEDTNTIPVNKHDFPVDWILVPEAAIQVTR